MRITVALTLLLATVLLSSCKRISAADGRIQSIESNLESLRKVPGLHKNTGGQETAFTAYFQQADVQLIEETPPAGGSWSSRYYFLEGNLFFFRRQNGRLLEQQFLIDKNGQIRRVQPESLPATEVAAITAHAEELKKEALARANSPIVLPLLRGR
ncbi:MAG: hypothetical protein HY235_25835 [Acidobacteria bacterium]|nr:hypothetical protein [Acidobacteriota bacterium]